MRALRAAEYAARPLPSLYLSRPASLTWRRFARIVRASRTRDGDSARCSDANALDDNAQLLIIIHLTARSFLSADFPFSMYFHFLKTTAFNEFFFADSQEKRALNGFFRACGIKRERSSSAVG